MDPNRRSSLVPNPMQQLRYGVSITPQQQQQFQLQQQQLQQQQMQQQELLRQQQLQLHHQQLQNQQYQQVAPQQLYPVQQNPPLQIQQISGHTPHNLHGLTPMTPPAAQMNQPMGQPMAAPSTPTSTTPMQNHPPQSIKPFSERVDSMIQNTLVNGRPFNIHTDGVPFLTKSEYDERGPDIQRLVSDNTTWQLSSTPKDPMLWNTAQLRSNLFRDSVMAKREGTSPDPRQRAFQGMQDKTHSKTFFKTVAKILEDNAVIGDVLLRHITKEEIKDGLKITTWNWRCMLWDWVEALRDMSPTYQKWLVDDQRKVLEKQQRLHELVGEVHRREGAQLGSASTVSIARPFPTREITAPPGPLFSESFQPLRYEELRRAPPRVVYTVPGRSKKARIEFQEDDRLPIDTTQSGEKRSLQGQADAGTTMRETGGNNAQEQARATAPITKEPSPTETARDLTVEEADRAAQHGKVGQSADARTGSCNKDTPVEMDSETQQTEKLPETANGAADQFPDADNDIEVADAPKLSEQTTESPPNPELSGSIRDLRTDDWAMFEPTEDEHPKSPFGENPTGAPEQMLHTDMSTLSGEVMDHGRLSEQEDESAANIVVGSEIEKPGKQETEQQEKNPDQPEILEEEPIDAQQEPTVAYRSQAAAGPRPSSPHSLRSSPTIPFECEESGGDVVVGEASDAPALTPPKSSKSDSKSDKGEEEQDGAMSPPREVTPVDEPMDDIDDVTMEFNSSQEQKALAEQLKMDQAVKKKSILKESTGIEAPERPPLPTTAEDEEDASMEDDITEPAAEGVSEHDWKAPTPVATMATGESNGNEELRAVKEEAVSPEPGSLNGGILSGFRASEIIVIDDSDSEETKDDSIPEVIRVRKVKTDFLSQFEGREEEVLPHPIPKKVGFHVKYLNDPRVEFICKIALKRLHSSASQALLNPKEGLSKFLEIIRFNTPQGIPKDDTTSYSLDFQFPHQGRENSQQQEGSSHSASLIPGLGDEEKWRSIVRAVLVLGLEGCKVLVKVTVPADSDKRESSKVRNKITPTVRSSVDRDSRNSDVARYGTRTRQNQQNSSYLAKKPVYKDSIYYSQIEKGTVAPKALKLATAFTPATGTSSSDYGAGSRLFVWRSVRRVIAKPPGNKGKVGRFGHRSRTMSSETSFDSIHRRFEEANRQEADEDGAHEDDSQPVLSLLDLIKNRQDDFDPDQLEKWNKMEDDAVLPLLNESGDEGDYDEQTLREIEKEELLKAGAAEKVQPKKKLSVDEIRIIIQDEIRRYQTLWAAIEKPRLEKTAYKLWKGADSFKKIQASHALRSAQASLDKTAEEFEKVSYHSEEELKSKTSPLQNSVNNVEDAKWRSEILNQEAAPPGIPQAEASDSDEELRQPKIRSKPKVQHSSDESESDAWSGSDDGFIVDDDSDEEAAIDAELAEEFFAGVNESSCSLEALAHQQRWTNSTSDQDLREYLLKVDRKELYQGVLATLYNPDECSSDDVFRDTLIAVYLAKNFQLSDPNDITFPIPQDKCADIRGLGWPGFSYYLEDCEKFLDDHLRRKEEIRRRRKANNRNRKPRRRSRLVISDSDDEDFGSYRQVHPQSRSRNRSPVGSGSEEEAREKQTDDEDETLGRSAKRGPRQEKKGGKASKKSRVRKEIKEDAVAAAQRQKHSNLVGDWEARRKAAQEKQASLFAQSTGKKVMINAGHEEGVEDIFLHPKFSEIIKDYQEEGVQFLWREIVGVKLCKGALLSHTMGLGKTFQVIVLLFTLASALTNESMKKNIPEVLHPCRFLIICPPSLLDNWREEIQKRTSEDQRQMIGPIITLAAGKGRTLKQNIRLSENQVKNWFAHGGIILMGYDAFKAVALNKTAKSAMLEPEEHERWRKYLVNPGPSVVVADEAHNLKNSKTNVAEAASQFKTTSRIAMTGSPLSNNLEEYYSMINWIDPGYLGPIKEFRVNYINIIEDGIFAESTAGQRSKARVKLASLNERLSKKCHRRDITALSKDLPPKNEFVIKIPLVEIQKELYNWYINRKKSDSQIRILGILKHLQMLSNHPSILVDRLVNGKSKLRPLGEVIDDIEDDDDDDGLMADGQVNTAFKKIGNEAAEWIKSITPENFNLEAIEHSHRMVLLIEILKKSKKIGDKVLVFSHNLLTLAYVEDRLKEESIGVMTLTGKTVMSNRQASIHMFNNNTTDVTVFLMSTKAGGLGLNITGANRVVILDTDFNPTWDEQAVGRCYRLTQTKPVFVYRFQSLGTFEVALSAQGTFKLQLQDKVIDKRTWATRADKNGMRKYMIEATIPEKPAEEIPEEITLKDVILSGLCRDHPDKIFDVVHTETFKADVQETLSAEEAQEVEKEVELADLMVSNPDEYKKRVYGLDTNDDSRRLAQDARRMSLHSGSLSQPSPTQKPRPVVKPPVQTIPIPVPAPKTPVPKPPVVAAAIPTPARNLELASAEKITVSETTTSSANPSKSLQMDPPSTPSVIRTTPATTRTVITPSNLQNSGSTPSAIRTPASVRARAQETPSKARSTPVPTPHNLNIQKQMAKFVRRPNSVSSAARSTRSSATPNRSITVTPKKRSLGSTESSSIKKRSKQ